MQKAIVLVTFLGLFTLFLSPVYAEVIELSACGQNMTEYTEHTFNQSVTNNSISSSCMVLTNHTVINLNHSTIHMQGANGNFINTDIDTINVENVTILNGTILTDNGYGVAGQYITDLTLGSNLTFVSSPIAVWYISQSGDFTANDTNFTGSNYGLRTSGDNGEFTNCVFDGGTRDVWFNAPASNNYICGGTYTESEMFDDGSGNYWTADSCVAGNPEYYNMTVGVFSMTEYVNNTDCKLNFVDASVSFGGQTQTNATYHIAECCYDTNTNSWLDCYAYRFEDVESGEYTVEVVKDGYQTETQGIILDDHFSFWTWMDKIEEVGARLDVWVQNTTYDEMVGAKVQLYYTNGSVHTDPIEQNPKWTDSEGHVYFANVPSDTYWFGVHQEDYVVHHTRFFTMTDNRNMSITLEPSTYDINLSVNTSCMDDSYGVWNCTTGTDYLFTAIFTGWDFPIYNTRVRVDHPDESISEHFITYIGSSPHEFQLFGKDGHFQEGVNLVHVQYESVAVSNTLQIYVEEDSTTDVSEPMVDLGFKELGWVGLLFAPFSIITMFLVGIGAYFENMVKGSGGKIFITTIMIGVLSFTYLGLYPAWIGILIVILCGAILAKFVMGLSK